MKKFLLLATFIAGMLSVSDAQTKFKGTVTNPQSIISDATVDTSYLDITPGSSSIMQIQVLVSRTSGTMAGTVRLYGTTWDSTGTWKPVGDTLTLSNAAVNEKTWTVTNPLYKRYYVLQSGGTTVKGYLRPIATAKK